MRIDKNEVWEKLPDGSMRLIESVERVVSTEEEDYVDHNHQLLAEFYHKPLWNRQDLERVVRLMLGHQIFPKEMEE